MNNEHIHKYCCVGFFEGGSVITYIHKCYYIIIIINASLPNPYVNFISYTKWSKYNSMKNTSPIFSNSNKNNNVHLLCNFSVSSSTLGAYMLDPTVFSEHRCDKYGHPYFRDTETEAPESLNNLPATSGHQERNLDVSFVSHLPLCLTSSLIS